MARKVVRYLEQSNDVKALIEEVKKRPCLWDPNDETYFNRSVMAKCWKEIASVIKVNIDDVKAKWRSLRDMYRREEKLNRPTVKWRYFKRLSFLRGTFKSASNANGETSGGTIERSNIVFDYTSDSSSDCVFEFRDKANTGDNVDSIKYDIDAESAFDDQEDADSEMVTFFEVDPNGEQKEIYFEDAAMKKELIMLAKSTDFDEQTKLIKPGLTEEANTEVTEANDEIETAIDEDSNYEPSRKRSRGDDDYDLMFLKSLVPYFKTLNPMRRFAVRSKIQDLLLNEINEQINSRSQE